MVLYIEQVILSLVLAADFIQAPSTGDVRLTNSKRLEIYYYGEWGTVCDDEFDNNDAKVVCRQLGYSNGVSLGNAVDDGTGTIMLDDIECTGSESRLTYCSSKSWKDHDCSHNEDVGVLCNNLSPVNGGWSSWAQWTTCSSNCGVGLQTRTRQCSNPSTQYGGVYCNGLSSQTRKCNTISCPVNGGWTTWSLWNSCNVSCGEGMQLRVRSCNNPTPAFGGLKCSSKDSETKQCFNEECPKVIDGGWSKWAKWTDCTKLCNGGLMERARTCDSPPPINGGLYCNGTSIEANLCNTDSCSGIETKMMLALLVGGVGVGCILITVAFVLLSIHVAGCTKKQKKEVAESRLTEETEELYIYQASEQPAQVNTTFKEDPEELYIYQESDQPIKANTGFKDETEELYIYQESDDQPTQAFNNSAYLQDFNSKDVAKTGEDVDPCDIYENYEENCYENY
ncbi:HMCN [Mytilus edulis]|uniref:HMCN n=1 Tax=Mytilus edulis TaxID=6550 RepID=A0A8S3UKA6_MYTED|nr:HMCN [Mytilus edulis]